MDMEEAASHGAAMKSALLSPKFRLQTKFDIVDNCIYPIKITWDTAEGNGLPMVGVPPLPTLPPVDGVVDELNGDGVTGGEGGKFLCGVLVWCACVVFLCGIFVWYSVWCPLCGVLVWCLCVLVSCVVSLRRMLVWYACVVYVAVVPGSNDHHSPSVVCFSLFSSFSSGNVVQPIGDTSSCVVFDRNTKCGGVAGKGVGDRFLSVSLY